MTLTEARPGTESRVPRLHLEDAQRVAVAAGMDPAMASIHMFQILLHSPSAAATVNAAKDALLKGTSLSHRLREFIIMRLAWRTATEFVWAHHWRPHVESALNVRPDGILAVRGERSELPPAEQAVVRAADDIVDTGMVQPETLDELARVLPGPTEVIEAVVTASIYNAICSLTRTLAIPPEVEYGYWEPDGVAPPGA